MARTAVINPRGRNGRFKRGKRRSNPSRRRRRRNYGAAAANPPRRRRRSRGYFGAAPRRRRRRNPATPYASAGYFRRPNPSAFDFHELTETMPAATAGVLAARFALHQAGAWEAAQDGTLEPGIKQAIALWIGATFGGQLVGQVLGSEQKGNIARIAALGYAGDLFLTRRFMRSNEFIQNNFSLQGMGDDESDSSDDFVVDDQGNVYALNGFQSESPLGEVITDSTGNAYQSTASGWQLMGLRGAGYGDPIMGFQNSSPLGMTPARPNADSSFGYSRG